MGREVEILLLVRYGRCRLRSVVLPILILQPKANHPLIIPGIVTDLLVYSIVIPVMPFHLESLGYTNVSSLTGWLLFGYVGIRHLRLLAMILTLSSSTSVWRISGLCVHFPIIIAPSSYTDP